MLLAAAQISSKINDYEPEDSAQVGNYGNGSQDYSVVNTYAPEDSGENMHKNINFRPVSGPFPRLFGEIDGMASTIPNVWTHIDFFLDTSDKKSSSFSCSQTAK